MASYSFIVLHFVCLFLFGKTYLVQATACTDCPVSGLVLHSPWCSTESSRYHSPALLRRGMFLLYILAAVLVVEYTLMDHLYFCIYLFITRPQPQSSPLHSLP